MIIPNTRTVLLKTSYTPKSDGVKSLVNIGKDNTIKPCTATNENIYTEP